jgi:PPOX class probable F420-dependent enzyme
MTGEQKAPAASGRLTGDAVHADPLVRDLLRKRLVGVLATVEPDGAPHVVPLWYAADGRRVVLATSSRSRKVRNLERDPRATLCLHDSRPGTEVCGAALHGRVEIVRAPGAAGLVDLVHRRYVRDAGEMLPAVRAFLAYDDVALVLEVEHAWTWDERGKPATLALRATGDALSLEPTDPSPWRSDEASVEARPQPS